MIFSTGKGRSRLINSEPASLYAGSDALALSGASASSTTTAAAGIGMRTYYFHVRDGVPTRDRKGLEFPNAVGAIEHSKGLARLLRHEPRLTDRRLSIVVIDESGVEVHREPVYPDNTSSGHPCGING